MIPSSKWFPSSLQERAAWFQNFATQFANVAGALGFMPAQATIVMTDNQDFQFAAAATVEIDAYAAAFRQFRKILTEGDIGSPTPLVPPDIVLTPVAGAATGIFERLDNLVKRIRVAPAYTDEIGALLGILPSQPNGSTTEPQPVLNAVSMPGSIIEVSFVRGNSNGVIVETKVDNAATWSEAGKFFKSPAELVIPQNPQNLPRSVQMRARYVNGNSPVGQFSDIVSTATQPEG